MDLEELFQKYKDISLNIIKALEEDFVEQLEGKLEEREKVLEKIINKNQKEDVLKRLYQKYDLFRIDKDMKLKVESSMNDVRDEMIKIKKRKEANNLYNSVDARSVYISKKI